MSAKDEIKRLEDELEKARQQLFQLAKLAEMGKMVAVVAHELSQPLLGIKAFAQILRRRLSSDVFAEPKLCLIEEQAAFMEEMLNSLRQYSRSASVDPEGVDPLVPIRRAIELLRERARKQQIKIDLEAAEPLARVHGSPGHIQQVLVNLIGNALDEMGNSGQGTVRLRISSEQDWVRVLVADTGGGIPDSVRDRLFEPFYTTKGEEQGTGLGLSICRDVLRSHGGEIRLMDPQEVDRDFGPGYGAGFEVRLKKLEGGERKPGN